MSWQANIGQGSQPPQPAASAVQVAPSTSSSSADVMRQALQQALGGAPATSAQAQAPAAPEEPPVTEVG